MIPFAKFLARLYDYQELKVTQNKFTNTQMINWVVKMSPKIDDPTLDELDEFLLLFRNLVLFEEKDSGREVARSRAMGLLAKWLAGTPASVFLCVSIERFGFEMAVRVRRPRTLDQGQTDFCGQTGLLYLFAKEDPEAFVRFGCDLISTGRGRLRNMEVTPHPAVLAYMTPMDTPATDFMLLSSIRNALDVTDPTDLTGVREILQSALQSTQPNLLCGLMKNMGYRDIKSNIVGNLPPHFGAGDALDLSRLVTKFVSGDKMTKPKRTSFEAEDILQYRKQRAWVNDIRVKLNQGFYIIAAIDPDIIENLSTGRRMKLVLRDQQHLHYATIRKIENRGLKTYIKLHSWGESHEGTINTIDFYERFFGFVSARP